MNASNRPIKIGLIITDVEDREAGYIHSWKTIKSLVLAAERVGFDSVWIPDHLIHEPEEVERYGIWEAWSLICALSSITNRIRIGPHVLCASWRNPALIAKMADTVDEISDGRLILALGAGWHEPEYRAFDFPFDHRIGRFEESVKVIRTLLHSSSVTVKGRFVNVDDCELRPRGPSPSGPPIMIGTIAGTPLAAVLGIKRGGNRMLDLVATHADIWNCPLVNDPKAVPPIRQMIDEACLRNDRDPATLPRSHGTMINLPGWESSWGIPMVRRRRIGAGVFNGDYAAIADHLMAFAREGVDEVHIQLDPETPAGVEQFSRVLELLDA